MVVGGNTSWWAHSCKHPFIMVAIGEIRVHRRDAPPHNNGGELINLAMMANDGTDTGTQIRSVVIADSHLRAIAHALQCHSCSMLARANHFMSCHTH